VVRRGKLGFDPACPRLRPTPDLLERGTDPRPTPMTATAPPCLIGHAAAGFEVSAAPRAFHAFTLIGPSAN